MFWFFFTIYAVQTQTSSHLLSFSSTPVVLNLWLRTPFEEVNHGRRSQGQRQSRSKGSKAGAGSSGCSERHQEVQYGQSIVWRKWEIVLGGFSRTVDSLPHCFLVSGHASLHQRGFPDGLIQNNALALSFFFFFRLIFLYLYYIYTNYVAHLSGSRLVEFVDYIC